jgi:glyoxylase-like metal-dependent hydrolase (beta-lactamase superfamily II)
LKDPYRVTSEKLAASDAFLTSFYFRVGGNIYAFTYRREGAIRHTLIDSGDPRHAARILSILTENGIDPASIERIFITHRHFDHSGLAALLGRASKAKILVHRSFRSFVDPESAPRDRPLFGSLDSSGLRHQDIVYLSEGKESLSLSGVSFPLLTDPIDVGGPGRLHVLACPETPITHSPDQLVVLYSARAAPLQFGTDDASYLPTNDIVFAGDLWLMQGPLHGRRVADLPRLLRFAMKRTFSGGRRGNHREQDAAAKEALKRCFCLVRVKPGHGDEFIGSRIIPRGILADRDMLIQLGYEGSADLSLLRDEKMADRAAALRRLAYFNLVGELRAWLVLGYSTAEASRLLARIYGEQSGGNHAVRTDRKQRRARLREALCELKVDNGQEPELRNLAATTLELVSAFG